MTIVGPNMNWLQRFLSEACMGPGDLFNFPNEAIVVFSNETELSFAPERKIFNIYDLLQFFSIFVSYVKDQILRS